MSRTLFWYLFKDLVKVFFMASGALAAIMSFGGLLHPLTENGLGGTQVLLLLRYLLPAMSTYSLPIAALFATTVIYGRMAADNELTACRAGGISFISIAMPAVMLGLGVAIASMYLLCFTVPRDTMKFERVLVSNLAEWVAHQIQQTHEVQIPPATTIFAQDAYVPDAQQNGSGDAIVVLRGPMIISYYNPPNRDRFFKVPRQFYLAREAEAYIHEDPEDESATLRATLIDGVEFPRRFVGAKSEQGGVGTAEFGPEAIPPRLAQKAKFMTVFQLKAMEKDPFSGREIQAVVARLIREDQATAYRKLLLDGLNGPQHRCIIESGADTFTITASAAVAVEQGDSLLLTAADSHAPLLMSDRSGDQVRLNAQTASMRITTTADSPHDQIAISLDLTDPLVDAGDMPIPEARLTRQISVAMPAPIAAMKDRTAKDYLQGNLRNEAQQKKLLFAFVDLMNHLSAELHGRAAFVVSCLLLVLIGTPLGMMFKSGNFLTAFAVSVIPALFSMVLIVTGQHTAQATPNPIDLARNPLELGLTIIWSSNVIIGGAAAALLWHMQRQ